MTRSGGRRPNNSEILSSLQRSGSTFVLQAVRVTSGMVALLVTAVISVERYGRFVLVLAVAQIGLVLLNGVSIAVSQDARSGVRPRQSAAVAVFAGILACWTIVQIVAGWLIAGQRFDALFVSASASTFLLPALLLLGASRLRPIERNVDSFLMTTEIWPGAVSLVATLSLIAGTWLLDFDATETQVLFARLLPFPILIAVIASKLRRVESTNTASPAGTTSRSVLSAAAYGTTTLEGRLDLFVCASFASPELVGVYAFFKRLNDLAGLPTVIQTQRAISRLSAEPSERLTRLAISDDSSKALIGDARLASRETGLLAVAAIVGLLIVAQFEILETYAPFWPLLAIMAAGAMINALTGPTSPLLMTSGRERVQIYASLVGVLVVLGVGSTIAAIADGDAARWLYALATAVSVVAALRNVAMAQLLSRWGATRMGLVGWTRRTP